MKDSISFKIAEDDHCWMLYGPASDVKDLIHSRRNWVSQLRVDVDGQKVPAELPQDFVIVLHRDWRPSAIPEFLIEGIHQTAVIHVRAASLGNPLPVSDDAKAAFAADKRIDVFLHKEPGERSGDCHFTSHMQINPDPAAIVNHLGMAKFDPDQFVRELSCYEIFVHEVGRRGDVQPYREKAKFVHAEGAPAPMVIYQGQQADITIPPPGDPPPPPPPACNPLTGVARLGEDGYDLHIDVVTVKAYPAPPPPPLRQKS